jgi:hypothetical protein
MNYVVAGLEGVGLGVLAVVAIITTPIWLPLWLLGYRAAPTKSQIAEHIVRNSR